MNFHRLTRVTAPTTSILTLEETKVHLRVAHDDEDDLITSLIAAATAFIEGPQGIGIALLNQSWRLSLDGFTPSIRVPLGPVASITSVTYRDAAGTPQTLSAALYEADTDGSTATIFPAVNASWPSTSGRPGCVKVTFVSGYGDDPADVPADLRAAALLLVGHLYSNREAVVGTTGSVTPLELPLGVEAILSRYRVTTFG